MSWSQIVAGGSGFVAYRLSIEGWPVMWTSDPHVTATTIAAGRAIQPGLSMEGLSIRERAILRDAWIDCSGMQVTIVPSSARDDTLDGFTRDSRPVGLLLASGSVPGIDASSTTWATRPATLPAGYYHVGTETVYCNGANGITRAQWDTSAQAHYTLIENDIVNPVPIYTWPPNMVGRRANLYAYGEADDPTGEGTVIWRGLVARPPRMGRDGMSWTIALDPIIRLLDQKILNNVERDYRARGIYHSDVAPVMVQMSAYHATNNGVFTAFAKGFFETDKERIDAINAALAAAWTGAETGFKNAVTNPTAADNDGLPVYSATLVAGDTMFSIEVVDLLSGDVFLSAPSTLGNSQFPNGARFPAAGTVSVPSGDTNGAFAIHGIRERLPPWGYPLATTRALLGSGVFETDNQLTRAYKRQATYTGPSYPVSRIYLDKVDGLVAGARLAIINEDDGKAILLALTQVNATERYVVADVQFQDTRVSQLWLSEAISFKPIVMLAERGNWATFLNEVILAAPLAPVDSRPHLTHFDVNVVEMLIAWETMSFDPYWADRDYIFANPVAIKDVLRPELMATGMMLSMTGSARIGVVPLPNISPQRAADHVLTDREILVPADGLYGEWPTWEAQADGTVNTLTAKLGLNWATGDTDESLTYTIRNVNSIAEMRSVTSASVDLEPKSTPHERSTSSSSERPLGQVIAESVWPYMRAVGTNYATVTVCVPFTCFDIRVGQIVEVTSEWIPDGLGRRGVASKKAVCIERNWNLDPSSGRMGRLTLWFSRDAGKSAGYCPTGRVTAQTDLGGNRWRLTFASSNSRNVAWSESGDGNVAKHFAPNDLVRIQQAGVTGRVGTTGTVVVVDSVAGTVEVQLVAAWAPGSSTWNVSFLEASSVPRQQLYAYVGDANAQLVDGSAARQFV